jgi:hypothetical protein
VPAILSAASLPANSCDPTVVGIYESQLFASIRAQEASKGSEPDRMERLRELMLDIGSRERTHTAIDN